MQLATKAFVGSLLIFTIGLTHLHGQEKARPKYRYPEMMVIVYADFSNQPEVQLELAKHTKSKGFNCVEAELDKLEVCRKAGLMVRLGKMDGAQTRKPRAAFDVGPGRWRIVACEIKCLAHA
ncbi:MAG: hypothetical protein EXS16_00225 [Gemmataceae bacterium]|nr:hypothetical protein [Gemmataceae bacterium]